MKSEEEIKAMTAKFEECMSWETSLERQIVVETLDWVLENVPFNIERYLERY